MNSKIKIFIGILVVTVIIISGLWFSKQYFIKENRTAIEVEMPQPDYWDYIYKSSNETVAEHVSNFLSTGDTRSEQWLKEQLLIDQIENEKIKDYFNHRDYFRNKSNIRKEIILSLCIDPDKAYPLIKENFNLRETYDGGLVYNYPIAEMTQCIIRSAIYREDAINFLQHMLTDIGQGWAVKIAASEALSDIGDVSFVPVIQEALEQATDEDAVEYLKKSIKRIKNEKDFPLIDYGLLGGVKLNFSTDNVKKIKLVEWNGEMIVKFSENELPIVIKYIKEGGKVKIKGKMSISQMRILSIVLKDGRKINIDEDDNTAYFSYHYYDRYYNPQEKLWILFESKELSDFIKQKLNK